jgi:serine/threonine protein kinase/tetratricopeptide (TPR) repeat protein
MSSAESIDLSGESSSFRSLTDEQKERLSVILDRYIAELEQGVPQNPQSLLAANPDIASRLELYLRSLSDLQGIAAGFTPVAPSAESQGGQKPGQPSSQRGETDAQSVPKLSPPAKPTDSATISLLDSSDAQRSVELGDFILSREIGRGGMGVVYEGRQVSLDRRVAVKVLPFAAVLDSKQIARFKNEAQAAAQLHHPNIVPVFAIGADRGMHFYAMQYIEGQPLDQAIRELRRQDNLDVDPGSQTVASSERDSSDDSRNTTVADRAAVDRALVDRAAVDRAIEDLCGTTQGMGAAATKGVHQLTRRIDGIVRLAIDAANALHCAHEYGVVHRDIKPSNLILDENGKIWITDFGLARCQGNVTLTKTGDIIGTMRYMSPEQALGKNALVDHRTDIYSLAATLYELLSLTPAIPGEDEPQVLRNVVDRDPRPIRQIRSEIPADLATVLGKAMAKYRDDRYTTAEEFADDLRRVIEGKPTFARPPTWIERGVKWARRHKSLVAGAAAICFILVVGSSLSTFLIAREKLKADSNAARAEQRLREAHTVVDRFGSQFAERLATIEGAETLRNEVLQETLGYYRNFVQEASGNPALQFDLAMTYSKIGSLSGEIGSSKDSIEAHTTAIDMFRTLADREPHEREYRRHWAMSQNNLGLALRRAGRLADATTAYRAAIDLQKEMAGQPDHSAEALTDLALSYTNIGLLHAETNQIRDAVDWFHQAIDLQKLILAQISDDQDGAAQRLTRIGVLRKLAASYNNLSSVYLESDTSRSIEYYQRALQHQVDAAKLDSDGQEIQSQLALIFNNLGAAQSRQELLEDAAASQLRAIEIQDRLVKRAPAKKRHRRDLAVSINNQGLLHRKLKRLDEAEAAFGQAVELLKDLVLQYPEDLDLQSQLGGTFNNHGIVLEQLDRQKDAAVAFKRAVEHQRLAFNRSPTVTRYRDFLSKHYFNYGRLLRELGHPEQAARAAMARRDLWPGDPDRLVSIAKELKLAAAALERGTVPTELSPAQCNEWAAQTLEMAVAITAKTEDDAKCRSEFSDLDEKDGSTITAN